MRFTDEQMQEIGEARERLRAYQDKIQIYPPLLGEEPQPYYPPALPEHRLMEKLRQVEGIANYTKTKLQEHLSSKRGNEALYDSIKKE